MPREVAIVVMVALVAAELLVYYLSRTSQGFRERLSRLGLTAQPGALLLDLGGRVGPRVAGRSVRYPLLALSVCSLALSVYLFYSILLGYVAELVASVSRGAETPQSPLVPIIPGITLGLDILPPLLVAIGVGLVAHELSHMLAAVVNGVPIESWGVGLALIFPVAYVRTDEEAFASSRLTAKASILGAGVAANLVLGLLSLVLLGAVAQPLSAHLEGPYVLIVGVDQGMPAGRSGLRAPAVLEQVNGTAVDSLEGLRRVLNTSLEGTTTFRFRVRPLVGVGFCGYLVSSSEAEEYLVVRTAEDARRYGYRVGIAVAPVAYVFPSGTPTYLLYADCQLRLLYVVNFSLAAVNAAPLLVTDGGRLLSELLRRTRARGLDRAVQWTTLALTALVVAIGLAQSLAR